MKRINIVVPIYNEEGNITELLGRLEGVFVALPGWQYEVVFVNDGSADRTQQILEEESRKDPRVKYIELSRNFGHQAALKAGLSLGATGADAVVSMDGDLQHPPELIPELIGKWKEGYEVVYTVREYDEEASFFKKITSEFYYKLQNLLTDFSFEKGEGGDYKLYDKKVISVIRKNREADLFLRGFSKWVGFRQIGVRYKAGSRSYGKSHYTFRKMLGLGLSGITSFSVKPLYFAAYLGFFFSLLSLFYIPYVIRAFVVGTEISGWASLIMTVVFFGGLQLSMLGIIGIYLGKTFRQVKDRPLYIVKSKNVG